MSSSLHIHYEEEVFAQSRGRYSTSFEYSDTPLAVSFQTLRQLLNQAHNLQTNINTLRQVHQDLDIDSVKAQDAMFVIDTSALEINDFLKACLERIPVDRRPSNQSAAKAQQVFNTPELLENILLHLPTQDLLVAQKVGRCWRDNVNSSVNIQRALGLRPHEDSFYYSPFTEHYRGYSYRRNDKITRFAGLCWKDEDNWSPFELPEDQFRDVPTTFDFFAGIDCWRPLSIGSRCRSMLLCQPPLKEAFLVYQHPYSEADPSPLVEEFELVSSTGITVGDVMDAATQIYDCFRTCDDLEDDFYCNLCESEREHGMCNCDEPKEKHEPVFIRLEATMPLEEDHPIMKSRREKVKAAERWREERQAHKERRARGEDTPPWSDEW